MGLLPYRIWARYLNSRDLASDLPLLLFDHLLVQTIQAIVSSTNQWRRGKAMKLNSPCHLTGCLPRFFGQYTRSPKQGCSVFEAIPLRNKHAICHSPRNHFSLQMSLLVLYAPSIQASSVETPQIPTAHYCISSSDSSLHSCKSTGRCLSAGICFLPISFAFQLQRANTPGAT